MSEAEAAAPVTANATRGELSITLDGAEYVLRPSFEAISAFEAATGKGIIQLARDADSGVLGTGALAQIVAETMRAQGRAIGDNVLAASQTKTVAGLIIESDGGVHRVMAIVAGLLAIAATGGYTASGELKATAATAN